MSIFELETLMFHVLLTFCVTQSDKQAKRNRKLIVTN